MKTLYIHIGLPKTATTFLRTEIFPRIKDVNYIDVTGKDIYPHISKIPCNSTPKYAFEKVREYFLKKSNKKNNLTSYGTLSGIGFSPNAKERIKLLKEVKSIFEDFNIKIILILREQRDIISSFYKYYVHLGMTLTIQDFLFSKETYFDIKKCVYSNLLSEMYEIFSKDNVYLDFYENFNGGSKLQFLENMMGFIGEGKVPNFNDRIIRKGYGVYQMKTAKFLNNFFSSYQSPNKLIPMFNLPKYGVFSLRLLILNRVFNKLPYKEYVLPVEIQKKLKELYLKDNMAINEKYNLNLSNEYLDYDGV